MDLDVPDLILLEDDGLILVNKPAGTPTAGDTLEQAGSMQRALMDHYRRMIWAVHQLDRDTSGLNLFVRRKRLVAEWTDALKRGAKTYLAICHGAPAQDAFLVDAPIGYDRGAGRRAVLPDGQDARTRARVLARSKHASLVEATLETGRTHQIRVHMMHAGHPLLGESRYIDAPCALAPRQMLHAWRVEAGGLTLEAPCPSDLVETASRMGLALP